MRLSYVGIIARKEFRDVLRDRRTLIFMVALPIVIMPLMMIGMTRLMMSQRKAVEAREVSVAVDTAGRNMLTALAQRWQQENRLALVAVFSRLGFELASLDELGRLSERSEQLRELSEKDAAADAALLAQWKALRALNATQSELLRDAGAVMNLLAHTRWIDPAEVASDGRLAPGVSIPDDLPPELNSATLASAITGKEKALHAAVHVPPDLYDRLEEDAVSVPITVLYDASQSMSKEAWKRLSAFVEALGRGEIRLRLNEHQLKSGFVRPFDLQAANLASDSREIQAVVGGFLPYMIILFCFFGAFYPSLDLTAGEKERFTLETLLLAPVSRLEIAAGKFVVVFIAAIIGALLTTTSMAVTFTHGILPEGASEAFDLEFQPLALLLTGSLIVPVAALFAAMLLGVALCARSFKEAQSYAAPLQFLIILPALASFMPDLETELKWAWVPLMNVSLLMKELLKGNYLWDFYAITLVSMLALTALVIWATSLLFQRETVLLRT